MDSVANVVKNKRQALRRIQNVIKNYVGSFTGSNLRKILLDTGYSIIPGVTKKISLDNYRVYKIPEGGEWRVPLIESWVELAVTSS